MVQMNWFAVQKLSHRCREQMYGHQGANVVEGVGGGVNNNNNKEYYYYKIFFKCSCIKCIQKFTAN